MEPWGFILAPRVLQGSQLRIRPRFLSLFDQFWNHCGSPQGSRFLIILTIFFKHFLGYPSKTLFHRFGTNFGRLWGSLLDIFSSRVPLWFWPPLSIENLTFEVLGPLCLIIFFICFVGVLFEVIVCTFLSSLGPNWTPILTLWAHFLTLFFKLFFKVLKNQIFWQKEVQNGRGPSTFWIPASPPTPPSHFS